MTEAIDIFIGDLRCALQRFQPKPDDIFVLTVPAVIPLEVADHLKDQLDEQLPCKVIVICDGLRLEIVGPHESIIHRKSVN